MAMKHSKAYPDEMIQSSLVGEKESRSRKRIRRQRFRSLSLDLQVLEYQHRTNGPTTLTLPR